MAQTQILEPIKWKFSISEKGEIQAKASIDKGWHLYDFGLPEGGPISTEMRIVQITGAKAVGKPFANKKATQAYDASFDMQLRWFEKEVVLSQKIVLSDKDKFSVKGEMEFMACDDEKCLPPETVSFEFKKSDLPASLMVETKEAAEQNNEAASTANPHLPDSQSPEILTEGDKEVSKDSSIEDVATADAKDLWTPVIEELSQFGKTGFSGAQSSWWIILLSGFIGGFIALLTPCVWPMIPMTVSFFLKRSKSNRKKAITDALTYGMSIIVIYLALGLLITAVFGASALNDLSTSALFNLIFFALLVLFAVSFFGAFELSLPASWTTKLDSKADSTTGLLSIFFMAFTLVLVSFSCTGPIVGTLLVEAASMGNMIGPAIGMFGFALALSIPFALFAIFPSWLQNLPKSGGWLNSVKVVLGFLELALALKFLSVADLAYGWRILDRETFLALWIIIFAMLGFYLLGKIKFSHDSELKYVSVPRLFLAMVSLSFAIYMVPGLWGAPLKAISAFSPPLTTQDFSLYKGEVLPKTHDYETGMAMAAKENKPVLLDFTGYGCVNCRKMEAAVWTDPRVKQIIDNQYILISLYVDDKTKLPAEIQIEEFGKKRTLKTVGDKWSYLQRSKFGTNAQPFYLLLDNKAQPLNKSYAYKEDIEAYIQFLREGIDNYNRR
ncbi:thiol:disulfide interchange protein [Bacteroidales bacterium]|nr:thiol:disulfide interchange protein [Bacteroidales bacterium]